MAGKKIDLVVSFDTTGSMYPVLSQVRQEVEQFVHTMFSELSDLRIGIIAHGDYCDKDNPYTITMYDITDNEKNLCDFVKTVKRTYGGDADECYELVLNTAQRMSWRDGADKVMLMIGDASPHGVSYPDNKDNLDWKNEADKLNDMGIKVFSVHALSYYRSSSKAFYETVANKTGGIYLTLDQFNEVVELIMATCYQQSGEEKLNEFITVIRDSGKMTKSLDINIKRLQGIDVSDLVEEQMRSYRGGRSSSGRHSSVASGDVKIKDMGKLVPVMPGRFQTMTVDSNTAIKAFVESNGIEFKTGRGFYELSKAETVQQYKEVIIQDRETGEMFTGTQVREELGLSPQSEKGGVKERLHASACKKYRVFVQSTSVNRKLIGGTTFLYEISDIDDTGTTITVDEVAVETKPVTKEKTDSVKETKTKKAKDDKVIKTTKSKNTKADKVVKTTTKKVKADKVAETKAVTKKEIAVDETKTVFEDSVPTGSIELFETPEVAKDKLKTTVKKSKESVKVVPDKIEVDSDKINKLQSGLNEAIERFNKSNNKKNKTFLANAIKRMSTELEKISKLVN